MTLKLPEHLRPTTKGVAENAVASVLLDWASKLYGQALLLIPSWLLVKFLAVPTTDREWLVWLLGTYIVLTLGWAAFEFARTQRARRAPVAPTSGAGRELTQNALPPSRSPTYLRDIRLYLENEPHSKKIRLLAHSTVDTERLRLAVDTSVAASTKPEQTLNRWHDRRRVRLKDWGSLIKDEQVAIDLTGFEEAAIEGIMGWRPDGCRMWWGEDKSTGLGIPQGVTRCRLAIIGPSGSQYYYFMLVRIHCPSPGEDVFFIIDRDGIEFPARWDAEDSAMSMIGGLQTGDLNSK